MRKIFPILAALMIVFSCAVPAFAIGHGQKNPDIISALPFQYLYLRNVGGPFEYPFAETRSDGGVMSVNYSDNTETVLRVRSSVTSTYFDGVLYFDKGEPLFSLTLENEVVRLYGMEGIRFYSFLNTTDVAIWKVRILGSYYDVITDAQGEPLLKEVPFDQTWEILADSFYPYDLMEELFLDDFEGNYEFFDPAEQLFKSLNFTISLYKENSEGTAQIEVYTPMSAMERTDRVSSPEGWIMERLGLYDFDFPVPPDLAEFNIGSFLVSVVGPFLDFEIFPNFNLGTLLFIVVVIAVFVVFTKMMV